MPKIKTPKYYAFLDVVVDVFYSIILYNAFVAFPGLKLSSILMVFSIFIMLNYWWSERSDNQSPKYYLMDFYFIAVIMFIFSRWPNYYTNIQGYIGILAIFFYVDAFYSLMAIPGHQEKRDEPLLKYYFIWEIILGVVYTFLAFYIKTETLGMIILVILPYMMWFVDAIRRNIVQFKFVDNGNQPY